MADNDDENMMQVVRITINGETFIMFSPPIAADDEEVGDIESLEFGEWIPLQHVIASLMHYSYNTLH